MLLELTEDQRAIEEVFGGFFRRECPITAVRAAEPLGFDAALWSRLAELGTPAMGLPEPAGGGGALLGDLAVVADAVGRSIAPVPFVEHAVAGRLLARFGALTDAVVAGDEIATLAVRPAPAGAGAWPLVPAGAVATVVVGLVGDDLVAVRGEGPGTTPRNHAAMPLADRTTAAPSVLASGAAAHAASAHALAEWQTLTAAALTGIARTALEIALRYVTERHQFDRPIGAFQALQQQLADLPIAIDGAFLLASKSAWAGDRKTPGVVDVGLCDVTDFETLASMAFLFASDAAALATDRSLHAHGGYGYAEEYDIQLFFRRARGWALVAGDPTKECLQLSDRLFGPAEA
ncbi:MAG: acyl-CoA dehydrogenase [Acidimicrobiia bacterium]|jgi:alkylation response protein AidB-like acyl-CoA dehydrogenase